MFAFKVNQAGCWKNDISSSEPIPFAKLPKKPFQRAKVGSSRVEALRNEIKSTTASPLHFGDITNVPMEYDYTLEDEVFDSQDLDGRASATNYLKNRELDQNVKNERLKVEEQLQELHRREPVKLADTPTMNQIFYNAKSQFNTHITLKRKEIENRRKYGETIYCPDCTSKAKPF